jgi:hypothetical protein
VSSTGSVNGIQLTVVTQWSGRPRVLRDGQELPKDRWGHYQLLDAEGRPAPLEVRYSWWELRPRVVVGGRSVLLGSPVPLGPRVAYLAFLAAATLAGGVLGVALALVGVWGSLALLRRPQRSAGHVVLAVLVPVLAAAAYVLIAVLISSARS